MTRAAIMQSWDGPLLVAEVDVSPPGRDEVSVRIVAAGICPVDLSMRRHSAQGLLPLIPGHEASGIVTRVGHGVTTVREGDHVVLSGLPECGQCYWCRRGEGYLCAVGQAASDAGTMMDGTHRTHHDGRGLFQMAALGTFADETVVPARSVIPIHESIDLNVAALVGCALLTGVGAATRTASITSGDTVAVVGSGDVALHAIQGARLAGAGRIVAVTDLTADSCGLYGASEVLTPGEGAVELLRELTDGRGPDVLIDTVGSEVSATTSIEAVRRGGQVVLVGVPTEDARVVLQLRRQLVLAAKTLAGCWYGSSRPHEDIPILLELHESGALRIDRPAARELPLDRVNEGFALVGGADAETRVLVLGRPY